MNSGKPTKKLSVKITFSSLNPMDAEIIPILMAKRKKCGFIRLALYSYIKGLDNQVVPSKRQPTEEDLKLRSKISKLEDLDF